MAAVRGRGRPRPAGKDLAASAGAGARAPAKCSSRGAFLGGHLVTKIAAACLLLVLVPVAVDRVAGEQKRRLIVQDSGAGGPQAARDRSDTGGSSGKVLPCLGAGKRANSHELNALGVEYQQSARYDFAEACYRAALRKKPDFVVALFNTGTLRLAIGDDKGAIAIFSEVLSVQPTYASAHYNMGTSYYRLGQERQAAASFKAAVDIDPNYVHAHANLATVLHLQGDLDGAKKHHQESIRIDPGFADGWMNLGNVLKALGQVEAAIQSYTTATTLRPDYAMAHYNLGVAHMSSGNHAAAIESYREATRHNSEFYNAYYNMGLSLQAVGQLEGAIKALRKATAKEGGFALSAYNNLGTVLDQLARLPEAIQAYKTALKLMKDGDATESSVIANLYSALQAVCDWEGTAELDARLMRLLETAMRAEGDAGSALHPFHSVTYPFSASLALRIARFHARSLAPVDSWRPLYSLHALLPSTLGASAKTLRVAYMLDSLSNGTISQYVPSLLASHDRRLVETYVYMMQDSSPVHSRLIHSLQEASTAVRNLSGVLRSGSPRGAAEAASNIISSDAIHVLMDLSENGGGARHTVLALAPAPIHISVAFRSTQGAVHMQYALSDSITSPPEYAAPWVERLLVLPAPALVMDFDLSLQGVLSLPASRESSASLRSQFGLPAEGVLFCSFGEAYKLDGNMLAIWTRILRRTPNSTLWLPRYNALAEEHLRMHVRKQGLDDKRLIFSPPTMRCLGGKCTRHNGKGSLVLSDSEYLAASLTADIYLDTGPLISSPLALASLVWAAVPAVAFAGERAVSRGSGSLLLGGSVGRGGSQDGRGCPGCGLVANSAAEYEPPPPLRSTRWRWRRDRLKWPRCASFCASTAPNRLFSIPRPGLKAWKGRCYLLGTYSSPQRGRTGMWCCLGIEDQR